MHYLGLLINAYFFTLPSFATLSYKSLESRAPVMYSHRRRSDGSSSYIIKHYTSGLTEYQGLSHIGNAGNYRQEEMTAAHTREKDCPRHT